VTRFDKSSHSTEPGAHTLSSACRHLEWPGETVIPTAVPALASVVNRGSEPFLRKTEVCIPEGACRVSCVVVPGIPASRPHGTSGTTIHPAALDYCIVSTHAWAAV
jgi:hypothetical protein